MFREIFDSPAKGRKGASPERMREMAAKPRSSGSPSISPRFRDPADPGRGLIGFGISPNKALTTGFMERALRALGLTVGKYNDWTGLTRLQTWIDDNPGYTQRAWFTLLVENIDVVRGG